MLFQEDCAFCLVSLLIWTAANSSYKNLSLIFPSWVGLLSEDSKKLYVPLDWQGRI